MLITGLLPLLARYALGFDLVAGPDGTVTLTVIPRKAPGAAHDMEGGEARPISLTAPAAEIDAELAKGLDGALGQLIASRKALGDQLQEQRDAAEAEKAAAAAKTKGKAGTGKAATAAPAPAPAPAAPATPTPPAAAPAPGEPASLW